MRIVDEVAMLGTLNFIEQLVRLFIASSMPSSCGSAQELYNGRFAVE